MKLYNVPNYTVSSKFLGINNTICHLPQNHPYGARTAIFKKSISFQNLTNIHKNAPFNLVNFFSKEHYTCSTTSEAK